MEIEVCEVCHNYGSDPEEGTCPKCNPVCPVCERRYYAKGGGGCPRNCALPLKCVPSDICSAFGTRSIGTRASDPIRLLEVIEKAVAAHDFTKDRVPGQAFIELPEAVPFISAGVGPRSKDPDDYVLREHRGIVSAYLKRRLAAEVTGCAVVVYTLAAYGKDPDVDWNELERCRKMRATHVVVAILGRASPSSPLPPYRLVWNLAGGNHEAALWSADEIREKAKAAIDYDSAWVTVAD